MPTRRGDYYSEYFETDADWLWCNEGERRGWVLPEAPHWGWCVWGVRHARACWAHLVAHYEFRIDQPGGWAALWHRQWVAYAIERGWA